MKTVGEARKRANQLRHRTDRARLRKDLERQALMHAVDDQIAEGMSEDHDLLALVAQQQLRDAWKLLRQEAVAGIGERSDWDSTVRLTQAVDALEQAATRADRMGLGGWSPYGNGSKHSYFKDIYARDSAMRSNQPVPAEVSTRLFNFESVLPEVRTGLGITSSFVAPAFYDIAEFADIPRPERVLAELVPTKPLPKGAAAKIPVLSASGAVQITGQNVAPTEVDIVDAYVTSTVAWITGEFTVSLQAFEQSWDPTLDEAAAEILMNAYDEELETQLTTGTGSSGQLPGLVEIAGTTVTYTAGTPTVQGVLGAIGQAVGQAADARDKLPEAIVMRPARWAWIASSLDDNGRTIVNVHGHPDPAVAGGATPVGRIFGIPVFTSAAIPADVGTGANQDEILVTRPSDHRIYASRPNVYAFPDTNEAGNLSVFIGLAGSAVFIPSRFPSATAVVTGSGLVVPSNF